MQEQSVGVGLLAALGGTGAAIGLAQLLITDEPLTLRRAAGRAMVTAGLSVGAAAAVAWLPNIPFYAVVGLGAAMASLGTTGLEKLLQRFFRK
jgi:hypothetical protein